MRKFVRRFLCDESGEDLIEYGLLVAFAASVAIAVVAADPIGFKDALVAAFNRAVTALRNT